MKNQLAFMDENNASVHTITKNALNNVYLQ